jgi:hypothetical protein
MAGCVLRVSGATFPVDAFLAQSTFAACKVWHCGDRSRNGHHAASTNGFNTLISEAGDLLTQVSDAIQFLNQHRDQLLRLSRIAEADDLVLDFGIPQLDVLAQFEAIPSDLVRAAAEFRMGFELSLYAISNSENTP